MTVQCTVRQASRESVAFLRGAPPPGVGGGGGGGVGVEVGVAPPPWASLTVAQPLVPDVGLLRAERRAFPPFEIATIYLKGVGWGMVAHAPHSRCSTGVGDGGAGPPLAWRRGFAMHSRIYALSYSCTLVFIPSRIHALLRDAPSPSPCFPKRRDPYATSLPGSHLCALPFRSLGGVAKPYEECMGFLSAQLKAMADGLRTPGVRWG